MVINVQRFIRNAARAEDARKAQAVSQLPHRECYLHSSGHLKISTDHAEGQPSPPPDPQRCKEQMISNGWCPHQVHHLSKTYEPETFSYLATLERSSQRLADHKRCSGYSACIAYNTDAATYKARHTTDDCTCSMISTPYRDLVRIIRRGGIPLVSIEGGAWPSPTHKLQVHSRSAASKYIAISHVWADGLGNPSENGLPECQIKRLHANLLALQWLFGTDNEPVLFWMDTLCIPVGPDERSLRLIQIDKMASIYKGAMTSLALDAELMASIPHTKLPSTEACEKDAKTHLKSQRRLSVGARARIACSVWMCRSWTFQEGELPATIAVQFMDNAVVLGRASVEDGMYRERFTDGRSSPDESSEGELEANNSASLELEGLDLPDTRGQNSDPLASQCKCVDIDLQRTLFKTFFKESNELATVWNELSGRSTTMPNDIPIIITNTLDLDNRNLLTYHDIAEMFQAILLSLGRLPMSLFFNTGPRKNGKHQNRWVPVKVGADTLASENWLIVRSNHLLYRYTPKNICSDFSVFIVNKILSLSSTVYLHSGSEDTIYTVEPSGSSADQLDTGGFASTCVIIENAVSSDCPGIRKGACFYVRPKQKVDSRKGAFGRLRIWSHSVETSVLELTFNCPIRLQKSASSKLPGVDREQVYALDPINDECDIKINYDPIPRFKPLRRRRKQLFSKFRNKGLGIPFGMFGGAVYLIVCFYAGFSVVHDSTGAIIGMGLWFAGFVLLLVMGWAFEELGMWRYKRSFAAIAAKRPREGAV